MSRIVRALVPLTAGAMLAAGTAVPAQAAPQAVGDVQLVTGAGWRDLHHTIRYADGNWQRWGSFASYNDENQQLASVVINGVEHVVSYGTYVHMPPQSTYDHVMRDAAGNWSEGTLPTGMDGSAEAVANLNGHLALVRKVGDGLKLSVQQDDNTWSAVETVPTTDGIGSFSVTANGDVLRVVVSTSDGTRIGDYERAANGTWAQPSWVPFNGGTATQVAVAQVGTDLQVAAVAHNGDRSEVWHGIRHANGSWDQFGYVEGAAGDIPAVKQIAVTNSRGTLQLVASTTDGGLFHTIRFANRTWQRFGDVKAAAGPTSVGEISLAGE
ncbi:hypothetical protein [Kutzneria kofuensis]|uniref:Fucose-binding lectin n=1 Tax=Kutzneria kofuensis TaxID=103725 RepID=A0A7W9KFF7_9PSEU|nr:hypothetical protein [Kutzneria kofuensis]MBB5891631.1 hypothetical protein [Kutzneria kofuensis]